MRLPIALAALYLLIYAASVPHIPWLDWFAPRGGILGLAVFSTFSLSLIRAGQSKALPDRLQYVLGGWILLAVPPIAFLIQHAYATQ